MKSREIIRLLSPHKPHALFWGFHEQDEKRWNKKDEKGSKEPQRQQFWQRNSEPWSQNWAHSGLALPMAPLHLCFHTKHAYLVYLCVTQICWAQKQFGWLFQTQLKAHKGSPSQGVQVGEWFFNKHPRWISWWYRHWITSYDISLGKTNIKNNLWSRQRRHI